MKLKKQVLRVGHKLSNKCTLLAINSKTKEQYSVIGIKDGKVILKPIYGAVNIEPLELNALYNNYHSLAESKSIIQIIKINNK